MHCSGALHFYHMDVRVQYAGNAGLMLYKRHRHCLAQSGGTLIREGSATAASMNWRTALGRSDTGNSHQVSHAGVSGSARNVGTCARA